MDCGYFEKIIYRLPDDDLTPAEREELAAHVAECADCRTLYDAMAAARESLSEPVAVPDGFSKRVMKGVHAEEKAMKAEAAANERKAKSKKRWRFGDLGLIAACLAMVVVVLNVVYGDLGRRNTSDSAAEAAPMMLEGAAAEAAPMMPEEEAAEPETAAAAGTAPEAAPAALEPMEADDMATEAAMDGGMENAAAESKAADSAPAEILVMDESGSLVGTLDEATLTALLTDADGSTNGTDAPPTWTVEADGALYELFVMDEVLFWRAPGADTLTRSDLDAQSFAALLG